MKKAIVIILLLCFGVKYGWDYLFSEKFQEYGDRTKAPWTCSVNNLIGHFMMVVGDYRQANLFFLKTSARCPDSPASEVAEFEIAQCYEKSGEHGAAVAAYKAYTEKYAGTKRGKIAKRALEVLGAS